MLVFKLRFLVDRLPQALLLASALLLAGLATADPPAEGQGDLAHVREAGEIVMLTVPGQENPFIRTNLEAGVMKRRGGPEHFEGKDVDLMQEVARQLGVKLVIVPAVGEGGIPTYDALIPALLAGKGDVIASSFSVTAKREDLIDFTTPYFKNEVLVVTRKGSGLEGPEDLGGKKAAATPGTSLWEHLEGMKIPDLEISEQELVLEGYEAVSEGNADFVLDDLSSGSSNYLSFFDNLEVAFTLPVDDVYALGVRPGSDLLPELNRILAELRESGWLSSPASD